MTSSKTSIDLKLLLIKKAMQNWQKTSKNSHRSQLYKNCIRKIIPWNQSLCLSYIYDETTVYPVFSCHWWEVSIHSISVFNGIEKWSRWCYNMINSYFKIYFLPFYAPETFWVLHIGGVKSESLQFSILFSTLSNKLPAIVVRVLIFSYIQ